MRLVGSPQQDGLEGVPVNAVFTIDCCSEIAMLDRGILDPGIFYFVRWETLWTSRNGVWSVEREVGRVVHEDGTSQLEIGGYEVVQRNPAYLPDSGRRPWLYPNDGPDVFTEWFHHDDPDLSKMPKSVIRAWDKRNSHPAPVEPFVQVTGGS